MDVSGDGTRSRAERRRATEEALVEELLRLPEVGRPLASEATGTRRRELGRGDVVRFQGRTWIVLEVVVHSFEETGPAPQPSYVRLKDAEGGRREFRLLKSDSHLLELVRESRIA